MALEAGMTVVDVSVTHLVSSTNCHATLTLSLIEIGIRDLDWDEFQNTASNILCMRPP
jgi:hypothetical protein